MSYPYGEHNGSVTSPLVSGGIAYVVQQSSSPAGNLSAYDAAQGLFYMMGLTGPGSDQKHLVCQIVNTTAAASTASSQASSWWLLWVVTTIVTCMVAI